MCSALRGRVSQGKNEKEALENIKEAITAWLWAEDQKATSALSDRVEECYTYHVRSPGSASNRKKHPANEYGYTVVYQRMPEGG